MKERPIIFFPKNMSIESFNYDYHIPLDSVIERHIKNILKLCGGNKRLAADLLGIDRSTLHRKLKEYELINYESS